MIPFGGGGSMNSRVSRTDSDGAVRERALSNANDTKVVLFFIKAGLVPAIHIFLTAKPVKTWMAGPSPAMTNEKLISSG
jgi:hypothetical protein